MNFPNIVGLKREFDKLGRDIVAESGADFTRVTMFPWKKIADMNKAERVQACYQQ